MTTGQGPLILGSTGRLGRALARVWPAGQGAVWQHRPGAAPPRAPSLAWDILTEPCPDLPEQPDGIILLAGPVRGDMSPTTPLARVAAALAARWQTRLLIASSQAVYGAPVGPADEKTPIAPTTPYGEAKAAMETAVAGQKDVTCLRIGNVAGCDALLGAAAQQTSLSLACWPDGQSPQRSYIGPATLARALCDLLAAKDPLPPVLNCAQPGALTMADLLDAADVAHTPREATASDLRRLELDVAALSAWVNLPPADPATLIAEARAAGWSPAS